MISKYCKCGNMRRPGQRNCLQCHAAAVRKSRKKCQPTAAQRLKRNCRAYANVYLNRGKLKKEPCENCGSDHTEMHHDDYDQPLLVRWFCRACHLDFHRRQVLHVKP